MAVYPIQSAVILSLLFVVEVAHGLTGVLQAASQYKAVAAKSRLSKWDFLNATLEGRLETGIPVASPCFPVVNGKNVAVNNTACAAVQEGYTDPTFRSPIFGAYMLVSTKFLNDNLDQKEI